MWLRAGRVLVGLKMRKKEEKKEKEKKGKNKKKGPFALVIGRPQGAHHHLKMKKLNLGRGGVPIV